MKATTVGKIAWSKILPIAFIFILLLGIGFGGLQYKKLHLANLDQGTTIKTLEEGLANEQEKSLNLTNALEAKQNEFDSLTGQISGISSTVGTLQKLSQTDPELLKKYSKVYFLNEHYIPKGLTQIDPQYIYLKTKPLQFLTEAWQHFHSLLDAANDKKLNLLVISAYRSFGNQAGLKSAYTITYGSGANTFSADQGYSEHQLGTAIDFTTPTVADTFSGFSKTPEYTWLKDNAWRYGFVISYPENNKYYQFEPWHWRYVGVALATELHDTGRYFYDVDQREIDSYLVNLFD